MTKEIISTMQLALDERSIYTAIEQIGTSRKYQLCVNAEVKTEGSQQHCRKQLLILFIKTFSPPSVF